MIREPIQEMLKLGPLPSEQGADVQLVQRYEQLYRMIQRPVSDDEARALVTLLGHDDYFGLAASLMHLIESAPGWPLADCLVNQNNPWIAELTNRCVRSGVQNETLRAGLGV